MGESFLSGPMRNAIKPIVSLKRSEREAEGGKKRSHRFSPHFIEYPFFSSLGLFHFFSVLFLILCLFFFSANHIPHPSFTQALSHMSEHLHLCYYPTCLSCLLLNNNFTRIVTTHSNLVTDNILMRSCPMPIVCLKCLLPRRTHS